MMGAAKGMCSFIGSKSSPLQGFGTHCVIMLPGCHISTISYLEYIVMQDMDCWYKDSASASWQKAPLPVWLNCALKTLNVPYAPSVWQEQPCIPATLR